MKKFRSQKGIVLVSLMMLMILPMIISGITLNSLEKKAIMEKAEEAKIETENLEAINELKLAMENCKTEYYIKFGETKLNRDYFLENYLPEGFTNIGDYKVKKRR